MILLTMNPATKFYSHIVPDGMEILLFTPAYSGYADLAPSPYLLDIGEANYWRVRIAEDIDHRRDARVIHFQHVADALRYLEFKLGESVEVDGVVLDPWWLRAHVGRGETGRLAYAEALRGGKG